ncbi:MAG: sigma-70 family RNA polymerase sigma factor [Myxococcales bacterium]|nr:sigma-70 family RNA polymerase sigma factor [Myxococcales bacterium]
MADQSPAGGAPNPGPPPRVASDSRFPADGSDLLARLVAREPKAFEEVVRKHGPRMRATARRLLRSESDADDCLQNAFLQVFRHIDRFEGRASLASWLRSITANEALMMLRARRAHPEEDIEPLLPAFLPDGHRAHESPLGSEPLDALVEREQIAALVRRNIEHLPENHRTVVLLRDIEGFSTEEVAKLLDTNENVIKARLHRARAALKRLLEVSLRGEPREVDYDALSRRS